MTFPEGKLRTHGWTVLVCQAMSLASSMPWTNAKTPACIANCSRPCSKCPTTVMGPELYDLGLGFQRGCSTFERLRMPSGRGGSGGLARTRLRPQYCGCCGWLSKCPRFARTSGEFSTNWKLRAAPSKLTTQWSAVKPLVLRQSCRVRWPCDGVPWTQSTHVVLWLFHHGADEDGDAVGSAALHSDVPLRFGAVRTVSFGGLSGR